MSNGLTHQYRGEMAATACNQHLRWRSFNWSECLKLTVLSGAALSRWEILKPSSLLLPEPKHSLEGEALEDGRSRRKDEQVYWEKEGQEKDKPILRVLIRRARKGLVDGQAMLCSRTSRLAAYFIRSNFILCSPKLANSIFFRVHILLREVVLIFAERVSQQTIVQSLFRNMPFHPSVNYIWKRELSFEEMSLPGSLS